jgi:effector-binding domain-containing protein
MHAEPELQERPEQAYAGLLAAVTMETFPTAADAGFPELFGWLAARGIAPAGAPFIRYHVIDMAAELEIELAVPVTGPVPADDRIRPGVLPAGQYVTLRHTGSYDGLLAANGALQDWARAEGIALECSADGRRWRGRAEHYLTDPAAEPDQSRWEVDVAYLVAGDA